MNDIQAFSAVAVRPDAPLITDITYLGGRGSLYLLALVQGHQRRQCVAPTQEATTTVLSTLHALGVVRAEHHPTPASCFTLGNKLPWSYTWPHVPFDELENRLVDHLSSAGRDTLYADTWLSIWQELISAEIIAYIRHQLRLHQFGDIFLAELAPLLVPNESRYSLGHWRYACWASVRSMASIALQHPGNEELLKYTLRNELPRRLQIALESSAGKLCFSPSYSIPDCTLSTALSSVATCLGDDYWKSPPNLQLL